MGSPAHRCAASAPTLIKPKRPSLPLQLGDGHVNTARLTSGRGLPVQTVGSVSIFVGHKRLLSLQHLLSPDC